jgi:hypothetical protein
MNFENFPRDYHVCPYEVGSRNFLQVRDSVNFLQMLHQRIKYTGTFFLAKSHSLASFVPKQLAAEVNTNRTLTS